MEGLKQQHKHVQFYVILTPPHGSHSPRIKLHLLTQDGAQPAEQTDDLTAAAAVLGCSTSTVCECVHERGPVGSVLVQTKNKSNNNNTSKMCKKNL